MQRLEQEEKELSKKIKKQEAAEKLEKKAARKRKAQDKKKKSSECLSLPGEKISKVGPNSKSKVKNAKSNTSRALIKVNNKAPFPDVADMTSMLNVAEKHKKTDSSESDSDSTSASSSSSSSSSSSVQERRKKSKKKRSKAKKHTAGKLKSGISKKSHKVRIVRQELYPHQLLNYEFTNKEVAFKDLSFATLVAGEMEILSLDDISAEERQMRIALLKKLAYHSAYLDQETILDLYATFVGNIEKGAIGWGSQRALERLEQNMLLRSITKQKLGTKSPTKNSKKEKSIPKVIYCLDYNKNRCSEQESHEGKWNGQNCMKHHVCSRCLKLDGIKRNHPETDTDCPNRSKNQ